MADLNTRKARSLRRFLNFSVYAGVRHQRAHEKGLLYDDPLMAPLRRARLRADKVALRQQMVEAAEGDLSPCGGPRPVVVCLKKPRGLHPAAPVLSRPVLSLPRPVRVAVVSRRRKAALAASAEKPAAPEAFSAGQPFDVVLSGKNGEPVKRRFVERKPAPAATVDEFRVWAFCRARGWYSTVQQ